MARTFGALAASLVLLGLIAWAPTALAAPTISGSDADVWNAERPEPAYTIRGSQRGARLEWRLAGTPRQGRGRSPLVVRLPALVSGRYRLIAEQVTPGSPGSSVRTFRVDLIAPRIAIVAPAAGATYQPGQVVLADYSCRGAVSCTGPVPPGAPIDTSASGPRAFEVVAADAAGNVGRLEAPYRVAPAAPVITAAPRAPAPDPFPVFGWSAGVPGATFTWQVLRDGGIVREGDVLTAQVQVGPLDPGAYTFQVREIDPAGSAGSFSVPAAFAILAAPVPPPILRGRPAPSTANASLLQPAAGSRVTTPRPVLRWRPVPGATLYNLQLFRAEDGRVTKVLSVFPGQARFQPGVGRLAAGSRYTWRVWPFQAGRYTADPLAVSFFDVVPPVRLSAGQLLINQRISQAAVRRTNAVQGWLDAGIVAGDLRAASLGASSFGGDLAGTGPLAGPGQSATPRPVAVAPARAGGGDGGDGVRVSRRQLIINQRISQAAVRRANGLRARLAGDLTGGDLVDGSVGPERLVPGVVLAGSGMPAPSPAPSVTPLAPPPGGAAAPIRLSASQVLVNQRISQAAVRRSNALIRQLEAGLGGEVFAPGSLTAVDLSGDVPVR